MAAFTYTTFSAQYVRHVALREPPLK